MQSLYIVGTRAGSGKSVVVLGIMEILSAANRKVGFFRPVVRDSAERDDLINLVRRRYDLPFARLPSDFSHRQDFGQRWVFRLLVV